MPNESRITMYTKYSQVFSKSRKTVKDFDSNNAKYLIKAGFVDPVMSGVYSYFPLGMRVLNKIEHIVRKEMDKIGQEVVMPALSPKEIWEQSDRIGIDVLLEVQGANDDSRKQNSGSYILNPTHEDVISNHVKQFLKSYKDLPISVYQIQNKFRNEARPKSGLLRGREFRMKDLYSFHKNYDELMEFYEVAKQAYTNVYEKLGIGEQTVVALASGGDFTENYSHEFQTFCEVGEDLLFHDESEDIYYNREVAPVIAPEVSYGDEEQKERVDVLGEGVIGIDDLVKFLDIELERTTKTILYNADEKYFVAAAIRGGYEVDEGKLRKVLEAKSLRMATESEVKEVTGTVVGYVGPLEMNSDVKVIFDDSCDNRVNFECGANKENYHSTNINWGVDLEKPEMFYDIKVAQTGDLNPKTGKVYKTYKSAEVGNIFPLETKFSKAFDLTYVDENNETNFAYMGSYGIGTTRIMGIIAEIMSDEKGLKWPKQIAPYHIHLVTIGNEDINGKAEQLISKLETEFPGIEILWDDRQNANPGEKFGDADLIGIPVRVVLSSRSLEKGGVEVSRRDSEEKFGEIMDETSLVEFVRSEYEGLV